MKQWLHNVRASDDSTKTFWHYTLTIGAMVAIIGIWVGVVGVDLPSVPLSKSQLALAARIKERTPEPPSIIATIGTGAKTIASNLSNRFSEGLATLSEQIFGHGPVITVSDAERNFILNGMEPIPKGELAK